MSLTRLAIDNNRTSLALLLAVILFGIMSYQQMPKDYDPGFILRTAQVITQFPGASPARVEQLVTDKIEKVVQEIPELDFVSSESRTGLSIISVNISESYKEMRPIWDDLRRKVEGVSDQLPAEALSPVVNDDFGDVYGIVIGLTAEGFSYREMKEIADQVKDDLLRISAAAKVEIFGEQQERIFIEYDNSRLAELNLSSALLEEQLSAQNIVIPGGSINLHNEKIALEPTGNYESIEDIRDTVIQIPGSERVMVLADIARVSREYIDPPDTLVSIDGERALSIAISMREGGNNILLGEQVLEKLRTFNTVYPIGVDFSLAAFLPVEVERKVNEFANNLFQAISVVTLVMLFSLGLRAGLIVATLIPCSMILGILLMSAFDIGIDQISLAALIISLGMLVDNGIVMSEGIMVQMENGKPPVEAAVDSAQELRLPLLTSSLTTAAAFLPIFLAESMVGEYTASLFKVVTITLLCSWLISMTIIPMLCVYFMKVRKSTQSFDSYFYRSYHVLLEKLINFKWLTLFLTLSLLFGALYAFKYVPQLFFPPSDRAYFKMELELPMGTRIEATQEVVRQVEQFVEAELRVNSDRENGVTQWIGYTGSGGPRFLLTHTPEPASANYALMVISVTDHRIIESMMARLEAYTYNNFPDLLVKLRKIENGAPIPNPVEVRVSGENVDELFKIVDDIKAEMASVKGLKSISDNWGLPIKKIVVDINQTHARRSGVTSRDIAVSLQAGLTGMELTQYREGDTVIPVTLRTEAADRRDLFRLESLAVFSQATGISVPLRQVADVRMVWEPANILRRDRLKTITIGAQLDAGVTAAEAFAQLQRWLENERHSWPLGYRYEFGGEAESSGKANQAIADKLPIGALIIVLLLIAQFNSLRKSVIILCTVPLAMVGVVLGLLIGQSFFGFMTLLGVISLAGIVINNAIVLLERIKTEIDLNPVDPAQAIILAAKQRIRPIVLTTATTVLGLMPLYLGGGEMWEPLALAIMGGLVVSTFMTLLVIPVLYVLLFGVKIRA